MARTWKLEVELHPTNDVRDYYCVEAFETVRRGMRNRVLHFALDKPLAADSVEFLCETISAEITSLVDRTVGRQERLAL